jgi:MarR family transcriptional regulator, organic hydroperoxide resistance regulator
MTIRRKMRREESKAGKLVAGDNFGLWKLLDHTRFMIFRSSELELAQFGLTPEQAYVLEILNQNAGETTINNIVEVTQRQHHTISTLIKRMDKQGLVEKNKRLVDSRKYDVVATRKAKHLTNKITAKSVDEIFGCLDDDEKVKLRTHLNSLLIKAYDILGKKFVPIDPKTIRHVDNNNDDK